MTSDEEAEDEEERQVFCSGCLQAFPESLVHVIRTSTIASPPTSRHTAAGNAGYRLWRKRARGSQARKTKLRSCRPEIFFTGTVCMSWSSCGAIRLPTFRRYCSG